MAVNLSGSSCRDIKEYLWRNQSDLTSLPSTMSVFALLYSLIIALGVLGNALVVLSVMQHRSLQSVRNMFIVSLSVCDIVISIVSGSITPITAFTKIWLFGEFLCYSVPLIQGASLCFSTLTLTAIAIDRYILIIHPTRRPIQKMHAFRMIALNITLATAISIPTFLMQRLVTYAEFCGRFCTEYWGSNHIARSAYGTIVFILQFVAPLIVITFCYVMISRKLSKGMLLKSQNVGEASSVQRMSALKRRMRTNRMLIAMVGVFVCCWMPTVAFNFLRDYGWLPQFVASQEYLFGIITHCISMSSTVWNPCLYTLLNEQFRLAFANLLQCLQWEERRGSTADVDVDGLVPRSVTERNYSFQAGEASRLNGDDAHAKKPAKHSQRRVEIAVALRKRP